MTRALTHRPTRMAPPTDDQGRPLSMRFAASPIRTQEEVAAIMTARGYPMSKANVSLIEIAAIKKLRRSKILRRLFEEVSQ